MLIASGGAASVWAPLGQSRVCWSASFLTSAYEPEHMSHTSVSFLKAAAGGILQTWLCNAQQAAAPHPRMS